MFKFAQKVKTQNRTFSEQIQIFSFVPLCTPASQTPITNSVSRSATQNNFLHQRTVTQTNTHPKRARTRAISLY